MSYELIPILVLLAILLFAGLMLIVDAARRAIHEGGKANHDLHV